MTNPIPPDHDGLIPSFVVSDAAAAIAFYTEVLGAKELMRMTMPGSTRVAHAELSIRGHVLMLGDECPEMGYSAPKKDGKMPANSVMLSVSDVDSVYTKALAHGATPAMPPMDMFWGDRYAKFIDPAGYLWGIATHTRDVSPEECAKGMEEWGKGQKKAECAAA